MSAVEPAVGAALPGEPCRVPPRDSWSDLEKWVWQEIGSGRLADINAHLGKTADPGKPDDWGPERRLSPAFLETILLHEPWRSAVRRQGVEVRGAWFDDVLDLDRAELSISLGLIRSRVICPMSFSGIHTTKSLAFSGTSFTQKLNLIGAKIAGHLIMRGAAAFADVILLGSTIGGQVDLNGSKFKATLNMNGVSIQASLFMGRDAEFSEIDLRFSNIGGYLDLGRAKVTGALNMHGIRINGWLDMTKNAEFTNVILTGAGIAGHLNLDTAKVTGALDSATISIDGNLTMCEGAKFNDVVLSGARIGGQLALMRAEVRGTLNMNSASIGRSLLMSEGSVFNSVQLVGASVGGQLAIVRATVIDALMIDTVSVIHDLFFYYSTLKKETVCVYATVGGNLDLSDATLAGLVLTGSRIGGDIRLASEGRATKWTSGARLELRNVSVDALQDQPEAWPTKVGLDGFTYARFGGFGAGAGAVIARRGAAWFTNWLARDEPYTPQPYHQCAKVLREMGHPEMADDVLYAGREREREEARRSGNNPRTTGLALLKWTIGYGYGHRYFRSLWWVAGFVVLGTLVLWTNTEIDKVGGDLLAGTFYSLDLLLPIIKLYEPHYDACLTALPNITSRFTSSWATCWRPS